MILDKVEHHLADAVGTLCLLYRRIIFCSVSIGIVKLLCFIEVFKCWETCLISLLHSSIGWSVHCIVVVVEEICGLTLVGLCVLSTDRAFCLKREEVSEHLVTCLPFVLGIALRHCACLDDAGS